MALENRLLDNQDYLTAFLGYTAEHISALQTALEDGLRQAQHLGADLNNSCTSMLGILLGIGAFLPQFFQFCAPAQPPFSVGNDKLTDRLHKLLRQALEKEFSASLPDQFVEVVRHHLRSGLLTASPITHYTNTPHQVLFDDAALYFPSASFCAVCRDLFQSRPVIIDSLSKAGLFRGKAINDKTHQTRITVPGQKYPLSVYAIDRSAFDQLGDPLIFEGEEELL